MHDSHDEAAQLFNRGESQLEPQETASDRGRTRQAPRTGRRPKSQRRTASAESFVIANPKNNRDTNAVGVRDGAIRRAATENAKRNKLGPKETKEYVDSRVKKFEEALHNDR